MALTNITSGFDLEMEISPLSLQQLISQAFEQGLIEQTYFLDPNGLPTEQLTIQLDPEADRTYSPTSNWQQPDLNEDQLHAFQVVCQHDDDYPGELIVQVRLLIHLVSGSLGMPIESSVEAYFHFKEEIDTELLHLQGEAYRRSHGEWLNLPENEREDAPVFGWRNYLYLRDIRFTDTSQNLSLVVNIVGRFLAIRQCNELPDGPLKDNCLEEVESRDFNHYFDQLLSTINDQLHSTLDQQMLSKTEGLGGFLDQNQDSLQLVQLGRIGLNALPGGALGLYLNTRQKNAAGFFADHGRGQPRDGSSLRSFLLTNTAPSSGEFIETPGFVGIATAKGYLDRLLPDLIAKGLMKILVDAETIDKDIARAKLLGDTLPLLIDKDTPGLGLPFNLKIKRIRVRAKEKKFRLEEDGDKQKLKALEIKMDVNPTAGEKLKLASNNLIIYLVPHLINGEEGGPKALRCFVETNLRVDVISSLTTFWGKIGLLVSAITALIGKKEMVSEDLGDLLGTQIPRGLYPFSRRWDAFYNTALGWIFDLNEVSLVGDWSEAQLRIRSTTSADQVLLPLAGTVLRSAHPLDQDGNLTFEQLEASKTELYFRVPGMELPDALNSDLAPYFDSDGTEVGFEQPIGVESKPYFSFRRDNFEQVIDDEEAIFDRVFKIDLAGESGSLQARVAAGAIWTPMIYFPVCAIRDDSRIQLLGVYSYQELEEMKETVYFAERARLIEENIRKLAIGSGLDPDNLDPQQETSLRQAVEAFVDESEELREFWENILAEAKDRISQYPGELRLQLTPLTMADLIDFGYAGFPGYTAVRQSNGEVYFRNIPNDLLSDNLQQLPVCSQLHFPA